MGESVQPIAVVGMSCRLPGAADPDQFWQLLLSGTDAVTEVPPGRWPGTQDTAPGSGPGTAVEYRRGGFVCDVDQFDAAFFGISPNEATAMDPQQRLTLELAWEALEHARVAPTALRGTPTGVFVGAISNDYAALQDRLGAGAASQHSYPGANRAIIANRVSYVLGLQGPSLTLDTGQSSSLVAVQLACESLRRGETALALAGGVNLNLLAETTAAIGRFGALSPDGRCHTFDSRANGYVRGEGGALVVLRPLAEALAAGDLVHCVILGGAVNNDGGGDSLTAPSQRAQQQVIGLARQRAGVEAADVQYVELHGTGTPVGDPVEAAALAAALTTDRPADAPLLVGSVKTNIGHLEGAAGIAGLLKVVLSLRHRAVPASLHFSTPNPSIALDELRLRVADRAQDWPCAARPLVAGVSSFGMGGTNCHLVLGEAPVSVPEPALAPVSEPALAPAVDSDPPWVLSARSAAALRAQAGRLVERLDADRDCRAADVALSLVRSRARFEHRAVLLGAGRDAKLAGLRALAAGLPDPAVVAGAAGAGPCAFVFPGQGSQWPRMARDLLAQSPVFAHRIAECAAALAPFIDYSLLDVLHERPGAAQLSRVDVVQPALWAVMVSLAQLWQEHGVRPDLVIGHSQGEIAAAAVCGALSLPDAARVVALRSRAITAIAGSGGMMSVAAPLDTVQAVLDETGDVVGIAAVNGPRSVVVSGPDQALLALQQRLSADGLRTKLVPVDYASHSAAVRQLREPLLDALAPLRPLAAGIQFVSTLTGEPIDTTELGAEYWYRSLRHQVRFAQATGWALAQGCGLFVECSPHPVLVGSVEESIDQAERDAAVVATLRRDDGGTRRVLRAMAEAHTCGAPVDWAALCERPGARLIDLPTYPFQRRRHWPAAGQARRNATTATGTATAEPQPASDGVPAAASRRQLRELVLATAAGVLGHDDPAALRPSSTFKELGFESATSVDLRNRLRTATGLRLPAGLLFDHPTPQQLAEHLHGLLSATAGNDSDTTQGAGAGTSTGSATVADPIAVVGMGCRYPGGVASPQQLWQLVANGTDAITEFPTNRGWDFDALFTESSDRSGTSDTGHGGFLHDGDQFDAGFFGISPREAAAMDPQQRLLLATSWEAVERAGIDPATLRGSATGVFVGAMAPDYGPRLHQPAGTADGHLLTGTALSVASGRIAYTLGLHGPAITVDTACSSSLVAIVLAMQALRRGECSLALAGGATVMSTPGMFVEFSRQGGLASDGRCKAFSAAADGTGWAEGAGMLVLQRLSDARRDGNPVLAVIRGGAVNQDGASNGMTAPNGLAQQDVIRRALADAGLGAGEVDAVEAHGTGTTLGDPIEAESLIATYGAGRERPLWLGSLKSNLGHTQAAAGVGGVIKMVQAMRNGQLPATLHAATPTPHVAWADSPVRLLAETMAWPVREGGGPARAAVSSFGISGTNAHLILEHAELVQRRAVHGAGSSSRGPLLWVLCARSEAALRTQAGRLREFAESAPDLVAAGHALARRARFAHRAVVLAAGRDELLAGLSALASGGSHPTVVRGNAADAVRPVFVFPGQGSQWAGMAAELLRTSEVFAEQLRRCDRALRPHTGWSLLDVLRGNESADNAGSTELQGSDVIQPALFAVMVSLAAVWRSLGVHPAAVVGHSQGEITAACAAGALSLDDAARIVALRSRVLLRLTATGGMLAVSLPAERVHELLAPWSDGRLWLAIVSGPASTVVAGDLDALDEFAAACGESVRTRRVAIDYAAHTPHIEAVHAELLDALGEVRPQPTDVALCSPLTGGFVDTAELTAPYWYQGLRNPVQFQRAVQTMAGGGHTLFIEASPHPVLVGHIQDTLHDAGAPGTAIGSLRRGEGSWLRLLTAAAQAFVNGADVNWAAALGPATGSAPDDLPTYPFEKRRYWLDPATGTDLAAAGLAGSRHPLLGAVLPLATAGATVLTGRLSRSGTPWLSDHVVDGQVLLPGTAFVELAMEAAAVTGCNLVADLTLQAPLVLPAVGGMQVQLAVGAADAHGHRELTVHARPAGEPDPPWTRHATGLLATAAPGQGQPLGQWPPAGCVAVDLDGAYQRLAEQGYGYGPAFQGLHAAWRDTATGDTFAEVALPQPLRADAGRFTLHPALLDAALHPLVLDAAGTLLLPFAWSGVRVPAGGADRLRVRITRTGDADHNPNQDQVSLAAYDLAGTLVAEATGLTLRRLPRGTATAAGTGPGAQTVHWVDLTLPAADLSGQRWAVVGYDGKADELAAMLGKAGADVSVFYDLASLAEMSAGDLPATVVVPYQPPADPHDVPYSAREGLYQALDLVQGWLGDERFAGSRLLFVTQGVHGAVNTGADTDAVVASALWGLVRSAQSEHPGRFALLDTGQNCCVAWGAVAAALAAGESQLLARTGAVAAPRLVSHAPAELEPAEVGAESGDGVPELGAGTVLVTGGTGRLGALIAQRLVREHGARHLLLLSRGGPRAPRAEALVARLHELGAQASVLSCDVSDRAALAAALATIPAQRPLCAVVHTAGVLDDTTVEALSADRLDSVFGPKADAAWHLHELTRDTELAALLLFSSVAATVGNAGQSNYAAANAFLDRLAAHRRAAGLAAVSVAWGLWDPDGAELGGPESDGPESDGPESDGTASDSAALDSAGPDSADPAQGGDGGMAGRLSAADLARLARAGIAPLSTDRGMALFDAALQPAAPALLVAASWDQAGLRAGAESGGLSPVLRNLVPRRAAAARPTATTPAGLEQPMDTPAPAGLTQQLSELAQADARRLLSDLVRGHVAAVLAHDSVDNVDVDRAFNELGFDSLTSVELRNRLNTDTGLRLPATLVFDHPTVTALAEHLLRSLAPTAPSPEDTLRGALERVESMLAAANGEGDAIRTKLMAILHSGLARLGAGGNGARSNNAGADGSNGAVTTIDSASDEEIFALIDNQL